MKNVDYFEAWAAWFNGDVSLRDLILFGVPIFWWGRIGKVLAFLAGLTIILDIVGPGRLRQFSARSEENLKAVTGNWRKLSTWLPSIPAFVALAMILITAEGPPVALWVTVGIGVCSISLIIGIQFWALRIFRQNRFPVAVRTISLTIFVIGFHFDMLAS